MEEAAFRLEEVARCRRAVEEECLLVGLVTTVQEEEVVFICMQQFLLQEGEAVEEVPLWVEAVSFQVLSAACSAGAEGDCQCHWVEVAEVACSSPKEAEEASCWAGEECFAAELAASTARGPFSAPRALLTPPHS